MEVSLAYFVYDLLVCLVIDPEPVGLVHHLCTIAGLSVGVLQGKVCVLVAPAPPCVTHRCLRGSAARSWWRACCSWRCPTRACT